MAIDPFQECVRDDDWFGVTQYLKKKDAIKISKSEQEMVTLFLTLNYRRFVVEFVAFNFFVFVFFSRLLDINFLLRASQKLSRRMYNNY